MSVSIQFSTKPISQKQIFIIPKGIQRVRKRPTIRIRGQPWCLCTEVRGALVNDKPTRLLPIISQIRGYTVAIPDYRLFPDAGYPEFITDIEKIFSLVC